jgi:hypothetical protein
LIIIISLLYHSFSLLLDHHHNLVKLVSWQGSSCFRHLHCQFLSCAQAGSLLYTISCFQTVSNLLTHKAWLFREAQDLYYDFSTETRQRPFSPCIHHRWPWLNQSLRHWCEQEAASKQSVYSAKFSLALCPT